MGFRILLLVASGLSLAACSDVSFKQDQSVKLMCVDPGTDEFQPTEMWSFTSSNPAPSSPAFNQVMASPAVGDLNGDGRPEVVYVSWTTNRAEHDPVYVGSNLSSYARNGILRVLDGKTGVQIHSVADSDLAPLASTTPLLVDLDRDGKVEIVFQHHLRNSIVALNYDGSKRWIHPLSAEMPVCYTGLSAADLDGDGVAEILAGNDVVSEWNLKSYTVRVLASATNGCDRFAVSLEGKKLDIVTATSVFDWKGRLKFSMADSMNRSAADVRPDSPGLEIISIGNGFLRILSGVDGTVLSDVDLSLNVSLVCANGKGIGGGYASAGNFDGDISTTEIAVATGRNLLVFDAHGVLMARSESQDCSSLRTGISTFDFNGDKQPEILYADEEYFRIYQLVDGELKVVSKIVNPSGTLNEYPVVADIDGNQTAEILVVANNYAVSGFYADGGEADDKIIAQSVTGIRAFSPASGVWNSTRPFWNQYFYQANMMNDDITPVSSTPLDDIAKTFFINVDVSGANYTCL